MIQRGVDFPHRDAGFDRPSGVYCELLQDALDFGTHAMAPAGQRVEQCIAAGLRRVGAIERVETMEASALAADDDDTLKALGFILSAWEEGTESGVAPELMAYAALYTALTDLVAAFGEDSVADLAKGLANRVHKGEFTLYRTKQ